ncbi:MAG: G8 domain-containing protein [Pseudomonadota bacterium]
MYRACCCLVSVLLFGCGGGGGGSEEFEPSEPPIASEEGGNDNQSSGDQSDDDQPDSDPPSSSNSPDTANLPMAGHNHCGMIPALADAGLMTATAIGSGRWIDPDTWGGSIPVDGDLVQIPAGIEVTVASTLTSRLETVRIDGALRFSTAADTQLQVDTLVTTCTGALEIGTPDDPVRPDVTAKIVFIDDGPVDDPRQIGRGAILMGQTLIHGTAKTHRTTLALHARQGDQELNLKSAPSGWQTGDALIVTGTIPNDPTSDEIRTIGSISDNRITLNAALNLDHSAPRADLDVYVANATRNVEFISENTDTRHRGHIMLMNANADIQNARFTELGRTDKTVPLDDFDFRFPDDGSGDDAPATARVTALSGVNIRGRYAIHFHQIGTDPSSAPALVQGSVVFNGPGWGFVNHSSHVNFVDNVAYGLQGAGFYTEAGDEIGSMQGNIAIRSVNRAFTTDERGAIDPDLRANRMDYGNDGDGYWLTGNRVSMIDNVASGASAHGIIYWTDGVMEVSGDDTATRVSVAVSSLPNGNLIPNRQSVPVWWAPLAESSGNVSYGSTIGFRARYIHADNYLGREGASDFHRTPPQAYVETLTPTFNDLIVWGNRDGVLLNYDERVSLVGARIVGFGKDQSVFRENDGTAKTGVGLDIGTDATHGPGTIANVTIEGFGAGFVTPVNGRWTVRDASIQENDMDLFVPEPESGDTQVRFENVAYTTLRLQEEPDATELPRHITTSP